MSTEISIACRDTFTSSGEYDITLYEIQVNSDDQLFQDIQLESAEEVILLRNVLNSFIKSHNLESSDSNGN